MVTGDTKVVLVVVVVAVVVGGAVVVVVVAVQMTFPDIAPFIALSGL